jgi:hypothetical protein
MFKNGELIIESNCISTKRSKVELSSTIVQVENHSWPFIARNGQRNACHEAGRTLQSCFQDDKLAASFDFERLLLTYIVAARNWGAITCLRRSQGPLSLLGLREAIGLAQ